MPGACAGDAMCASEPMSPFPPCEALAQRSATFSPSTLVSELLALAILAPAKKTKAIETNIASQRCSVSLREYTCSRVPDASSDNRLAQDSRESKV